jgi:ATP-binding cassette subfamily B protein
MFEHGRVVDTGTFDDLMRARGPFAELAKAQYLSAEPPTLPGEALSAEASKIRAAE